MTAFHPSWDVHAAHLAHRKQPRQRHWLSTEAGSGKRDLQVRPWGRRVSDRFSTV